ncbi:hypothetical protein DTO169E5_5991 [Paecilomyces variotii]|nr:hypothetical protein DTO169E5_5991 [Paecilomyces variotii]
MKLESFRIYWLAAVLCCGGMLYGYDSGVIGGVLTFEQFANDFSYAKSEATRVSSIAVGIQQAGALVGCFAIWPVTNRYGRKPAIMACSLIFCIGVVLETLNTHSISAFYLGRVICGLGIGGSSTVAPIYMAESSPKDIRGRLGSCYQFSFTIGILASYWIDYGVKYMKPSAIQWQIPIGLQIVPGALMGLGVLTLEESVRWLVANGRYDEAWRSLVWLRASDSEIVETELMEMKQGAEEERRVMAGLRLKELFEWHNAHRLLIGFGFFMAQQSTGSTALAYFGPQFFSLLTGPGDQDLLLTGFFGAIKVISCGIFVFFISDRFGRRPVLMVGAALMCVCMLVISAVVKTHQPPGDGHITPAGILTVSLIYLDICIYNLSWGPLPWPCTSEIFPTRIREPGVALGVGSQWLFNFVWSFSTPYIMSGLGWATFLLFGIFDVFIFAFVYFCVKETARKTLEEINAMFEPAVYHAIPSASKAGEEPQEDEPLLFPKSPGNQQADDEE